jgi:hypothetical protein
VVYERERGLGIGGLDRQAGKGGGELRAANQGNRLMQQCSEIMLNNVMITRLESSLGF